MPAIYSNFNSYYELVCDMMNSFNTKTKTINGIDYDKIDYDKIDYIGEGITKDQALGREVDAYNSIAEKNGEALMCAFKIIHSKYLKIRTVNPDDTQQSPG